jgi:AraC-like DNA-binding protein
MGKYRVKASDRLRSILGLRIHVELGVSLGMSARVCLAGSGVAEADLKDAAARVSLEQEIRVIRNLLAGLGTVPGLGVQAGARFHAIAFGQLGIAMTSSATARSALSFAQRFSGLTFALADIDTQDRGAQTFITIDCHRAPKDLRRFAAERNAAALLTIQRDLLSGHSALTAIEFAFPAPSRIELYEAVFGVTPTFGAKATVLTMNLNVLMQPLPQANEIVLHEAEKQCEAMLARQNARSGLATRIVELLDQNLADWSDMETVAQHLGIAPRTLRRRLLDEATTFADLRDEVRIAAAEELLTEFKLPVAEVSARLGYSSPTTFINAFKRWKGVTPLVYRKAGTG